MKLAVVSGVSILGVGLLALAAIGFIACNLTRPAARATSPTGTDSPAAPTTQNPKGRPDQPSVDDRPAVQRVGGDAAARVEFVEGEYRCDGCRITTPLPTGYPPPTPPGAIELKHYPLVRRAEISGSMSPDWGMNFAFFPLFNHIKRREIAMTSPVEMNYEGLLKTDAKKPESWTMSFLYRTTELGPTGTDAQDQRVLIEDIPPVTVAAVGMRGAYKMKRVNEGVTTLRQWLSQQTEWEAAGEPRALFYNGPEARSSDKWSEVQIPIQRCAAPRSATSRALSDPPPLNE